MVCVQMSHRFPMLVPAGQVIGQPILFALEVFNFCLEDYSEVPMQTNKQCHRQVPHGHIHETNRQGPVTLRTSGPPCLITFHLRNAKAAENIEGGGAGKTYSLPQLQHCRTIAPSNCRALGPQRFCISRPEVQLEPRAQAKLFPVAGHFVELPSVVSLA